MPSTLTAGGKDGKQSEKIERNTRKVQICTILLCAMAGIVWMFARGSIRAQSLFGGSHDAFTSKPAPALSVSHTHLVNTTNLCGSGLAREEACGLSA